MNEVLIRLNRQNQIPMLRVDITSRRTVFFQMTPDTHPNKGGYYVEVFDGNDTSCRMLLNFTIRRESIAGTDNRDNRARIYAVDRIKRELR